MSNLTDFVMARIAEDEARAKDERDPQFRHIVWNLDRPTLTLEDHVLAECEAKRRIMVGYQNAPLGDEKRSMLNAVRAIATIYSDHPDFREEWRA